MKKEKFNIEYPLSNASLTILWNSIGTVYGLTEWFADEVEADGEVYTFTWEGHSQKARLLNSKQNSHIRFQWEDDKGTDAYFEMKILTSDLSNDVLLFVTDFAESSETDDAVLLWNQHVETLKRLTGM
ncbi:START-like domain-containing protein [Paludibacter sp.]